MANLVIGHNLPALERPGELSSSERSDALLRRGYARYDLVSPLEKEPDTDATT
ncbi:MAG: hypothetical protein R3B90_17420 [Planctomycetaceae bacterium]